MYDEIIITETKNGETFPSSVYICNGMEDFIDRINETARRNRSDEAGNITRFDEAVRYVQDRDDVTVQGITFVDFHLHGPRNWHYKVQDKAIFCGWYDPYLPQNIARAPEEVRCAFEHVREHFPNVVMVQYEGQVQAEEWLYMDATEDAPTFDDKINVDLLNQACESNELLAPCRYSIMLTLQEVFDKAFTNLLRQGRTCERTIAGEFGGCLYKSEDGTLSCIVGGLLKPDIDTLEFEGAKLGTDDVKGYLLRDALLRSGVDADSAEVVDLLNDMQQLHDDFSRDSVRKARWAPDSDEYKEKFRRVMIGGANDIAYEYNLSANKVMEVFP